MMRVLATVVISVRMGKTTPYRGVVRWEGPNDSAGSTNQQEPSEIQLEISHYKSNPTLHTPPLNIRAVDYHARAHFSSQSSVCDVYSSEASARL